MDDIEDLVITEDFWEVNSRPQRTEIVAKVRRRNRIKNTDLARQLHNDPEDANGLNRWSTLHESSNAGAKDPCNKENCCQLNSQKDSLQSSNTISIGNCECESGKSCCNTTKDSETTKISNKNDVLSERSIDNKSSSAYESNIPGLAKVYVRTWGCAHNSSDSEYMAGQLAAYGYDVVNCKDDAELWLLNSCTVKNPAEDHLRNEVKAAQALGKKLVVAGCVSQGAPKSEFLSGLSIVGVQQIDRIVEVVEETLKGNSVRLLGTKKIGGKKLGGASLQLPKIRRNPLIEIISINTGCLNQCTYCKTKHARGHLGSYPIDEIVNRAEQSFGEGVVEIWLTSEDTGAYGRDIGVTLPDLLRALVVVIPEGCKLRLGMTNPPYILDYLNEMAEILLHPRVYRFLHVPVQSGSDHVLLHMNREYTREDFCKVVDTLRQSVPGITIATDIICGYPTETEEDFSDTMSLCRQYRFPSLFINQFFPRPGTPAARLQRIDSKQVKLRTKELSDFFQSYWPYEHQLGKRQTVLVTEESHDKQYWVGHNESYEQVLVAKKPEYMGMCLEVEITETGKHYLKCKVLEDNPAQSPALVPPQTQGSVSGHVVPEETSISTKQRPTNWLVVMSFAFMFIALLLKMYLQRHTITSRVF